MLLEKYSVRISEDCMSYYFDSIGPKGVIKKVVTYKKSSRWAGFDLYNLSFGDWDDDKKEVDDSMVFDNGDRDKVLATVALTIMEFTKKYGRLAISAKGVTPVRTRLYQMAINANLEEIASHFFVYGFYNGDIWSFKPGINYEWFLVIKKNPYL